MRFERHGSPPDLQTAFRKMIHEKLRGRCLDDNYASEAAQGRFPDFGCFRDILLVEMKNLETRQGSRINEVLHEKISPDEMPVFYGSRDANNILKDISNADEVKAALVSKLGRTIESLLRSANKQFEHYRTRNPRKNTVNLCVILNSSLQEFSPEVVSYAIHGKMRTGLEGSPRFPGIDAVLYISEKHFRVLSDGRLAMAMVVYECASAFESPWKMECVERLMKAWAESRTGGPIIFEDQVEIFETVRDVPHRLSRAEGWYLEYERDPYLRSYTVERLRVLFHRVMAMNSLTFVRGNWVKPSKATTEHGLRVFTHLTEEINQRGIDMREMSARLLTRAERIEVYAGFPDELVNILCRHLDS